MLLLAAVPASAQQGWGQFSGQLGPPAWGTYSNSIGPGGRNQNQIQQPTQPGTAILTPNQLIGSGGAATSIFTPRDTRLLGRAP